MRWNPFRRAEIADAADSSFESTVVDEVAVARMTGGQSIESLIASRPAGAVAPPPVVETDSIGHVGRYALKTVLGKGGLGTVYAAWDPLLSRSVALKTLHIDTDPAVRAALDALFLNEARAAAGLSHPHIVTVFDAGPSETGVYIAMERLQGQDLRHVLQQGVRLGPLEAAQVVRRVAEALAYAHRKGVVHCDVKPANIFMTGRLHPKVLDFGIARVAHRDAPAFEGVTAGSPFYLAPEQIDGQTVDRRSDVYSLGVVLYELLAGRKPFEGQSLDEIAHAVKTAEVVPAHRVSAKVPLGLSAIAARAMARDPDQRFPTARHLSMELRHWLESTEARALRNEPRGAADAPLALRVARVAVPLCALGVIGGLWWAKSTPGPDARAVAARSVASAPATALVAAVSPPATASAPRTAATASRAGTAIVGAMALDTTAGAASAVTAAEVAASVASRVADKLADKLAAKADATRKRKAQLAASASTPPPAPAAGGEGLVQLAVTPWGQVEVDGHAMGISPPLTRLMLPAGNHTITVRNADFPAYTATVSVGGESPATLRHRFGP